MIAPAMNTRPDEVLPFPVLARQKARISRQIRLKHLPRLATIARAGGDGALEVTLAFSYDSRGHVHVTGELAGTLVLDCTGCAESREFALDLDFECCVVVSDQQASEISTSNDVLVAEGAEISVADIVEDEILLSLPERLCASQPCERLPEMRYPALNEIESAPGDDVSSESPFAVLAELQISDPD
ncbi:MAG: DUF177 domain-containing protein [Pseudomonadales bacterium]